MTLDRDLDLAITRWLTPTEPLQVPSGAVRSALDEIAHTPQRRPFPRLLGSQRRLVLLAAAVLVALAGVAVAAGALDRLLEPIPSPTVAPSASAPPRATPVAVAGGRHLQFNDEGIDVTIPDGWQTLGGNDTLGLIPPGRRVAEDDAVDLPRRTGAARRVRPGLHGDRPARLPAVRARAGWRGGSARCRRARSLGRVA